MALVRSRPAAASHPEVAPLKDGKPVPLEQLRGASPRPSRGAREAAGGARRRGARVAARRPRPAAAFAREVRELVVGGGRRGGRRGARRRRQPVPDPPSAAFLDDVRDGRRGRASSRCSTAARRRCERVAARLARYRVNVLADRTGLAGAPVVEERFPSRQNLAGSVERVQEGPLATAPTRPRSAAAACCAPTAASWSCRRGPAGEPGAWDGVKRTIENGVLEIGGAAPACSACRGRWSPIRCRST